MKIYWRCDAGCGGNGDIEVGTRINLWDALGLVSDAHKAVSEKCEYDSGMDAVANEIEESGIENAASALGKLGGAKGGKARAASLSPERRSEIARVAAKKRWEGHDDL